VPDLKFVGFVDKDLTFLAIDDSIPVTWRRFPEPCSRLRTDALTRLERCMTVLQYVLGKFLSIIIIDAHLLLQN
jgi:hypothetical protein